MRRVEFFSFSGPLPRRGMSFAKHTSATQHDTTFAAPSISSTTAPFPQMAFPHVTALRYKTVHAQNSHRGTRAHASEAAVWVWPAPLDSFSPLVTHNFRKLANHLVVSHRSILHPSITTPTRYQSSLSTHSDKPSAHLATTPTRPAYCPRDTIPSPEPTTSPEPRTPPEPRTSPATPSANSSPERPRGFDAPLAYPKEYPRQARIGSLLAARTCRWHASGSSPPRPGCCGRRRRRESLRLRGLERRIMLLWRRSRRLVHFSIQ